MDLIILDRTKAGKLLYSARKGGDITHLISISDPSDDGSGSARSRPCPGVHRHSAKKLLLEFEDMVTGHTAPTEDDVQKIIDFAEIIKIDTNNGETGKLLTHCWAGISRSTAAAFIVLACLYGKGREAEALDTVFTVRPSADPNPLMVAHADKLLGRENAMVQCNAAKPRKISTGWFF